MNFLDKMSFQVRNLISTLLYKSEKRRQKNKGHEYTNYNCVFVAFITISQIQREAKDKNLKLQLLLGNFLMVDKHK
jgi:hypothetical protein